MSFRAATLDDVEQFWFWRQMAEGKPWYEGKTTTRAQHGKWFAHRLGHITLLVWDDDHIGGSGVVRVDSNSELAFDATHPRSMLEAFLAQWKGGRLKATVDQGDSVKALALSEAGFGEYPVRFFCYRP